MDVKKYGVIVSCGGRRGLLLPDLAGVDTVEQQIDIAQQKGGISIDLKGFTPEWYQRLGGDLETVKRSISLAAEQCHVEVTTLLVPGENDSEEEIKSLAQWLASVDRNIPLHLNRFFPQYQMMDSCPHQCIGWPMLRGSTNPLSIQGIVDAEMFGACLLFADCKAAQTQKFPRDKGCVRSPFEVSVKNTQRGLCNLSVHM